MDRRAFVRVVGGGVIAAGALGAAGCSSGVPDAAVSAWSGPGAEPDLRRWVLGHAILAPHSHNLQSWLVDLRVPGEILLRCDLERLLPETDPFSRQIMMSHGTFLELLDLAARERGHRAEITLFPEGEFGPRGIDSRPVARVRLVPDAAATRDPLFGQILRRRTNRNEYDPAKAISAQAWQAMADAAARSPLRFGKIDGGDAQALARHRQVANEAWRIELTTPRTVLESYRWLRVGASEIAAHRDGISLTDPLVVLLDRVGLFDRAQAPAPDDAAIRSQIADFEKKMASTTAFLWLTSERNDRTTQVLAGRAYARVQLAATAHDVWMHPLQQALQEYPEQSAPHAAIRRLAGLDSPDAVVQMWARVGHAPPVGPAPRRGVDAHVVRT